MDTLLFTHAYTDGKGNLSQYWLEYKIAHPLWSLLVICLKVKHTLTI